MFVPLKCHRQRCVTSSTRHMDPKTRPLHSTYLRSTHAISGRSSPSIRSACACCRSEGEVSPQQGVRIAEELPMGRARYSSDRNVPQPRARAIGCRRRAPRSIELPFAFTARSLASSAAPTFRHRDEVGHLPKCRSAASRRTRRDYPGDARSVLSQRALLATGTDETYLARRRSQAQAARPRSPRGHPRRVPLTAFGGAFDQPLLAVQRRLCRTTFT